MPKKLAYPKFDLEKTLNLCKVVKQHGEIGIENAALILKRQKGGHFMNLISSAAKFGLLSHKKGILTCTELGLACLNPALQQEAYKQAVTYPQGFELLYTQWLEEPHLNIELIRSHLMLSLAESEKAMPIIKKSFEFSASSKQQPSKQQQDIKLNCKKSNSFDVSIKSDNFSICCQITSASDIDFFETAIHYIKSKLKAK